MKAILVIDMPNCCADCQFKDSGTDFRTNEITFFCRANSCIIKNIDEEVSKRCPLKLLPEKELDWFDGEDDYVRGYNACIDEILGEEECN